eukprot:TRINITY_DN80268_c0_g1_i1.p1 TRINITY_DN80268_c0_g1~~TRINITY_DN80268_c0_g1_i1.p1  ORF type:complete len:699 (+),score=240.98 TRINITY_DN80268_c0_g1_i1:119-2215(+)
MGDADAAQLEAENARLKRELAELAQRSKQEKADWENKTSAAKDKDEELNAQLSEKVDELTSLRQRVVQLSRQLDDEVSRRDQVEQEASTLERRLLDIEDGAPGALPTLPKKKQADGKDLGDEGDNKISKTQVSTKLMRVIDQWMHTRDLQQALLRGADINDMSFSTLVQVLGECRSLAMLDLAQNQLTMDSCSDLCRIVTSLPMLSFVSVAENLFSLRSVGYMMTAVMERQNKKKLRPLEVLDISGNEGLNAAIMAPPPANLVELVHSTLGDKKMPKRADLLIAQVMKALWRFLHYTEHPQVSGSNIDDVNFAVLGKQTLRKMENALMKIMIMADPDTSGQSTDASKAVYANSALLTLSLDLYDSSVEFKSTEKPLMDTMAGTKKSSDENQAPNEQKADVRGGKMGGSKRPESSSGQQQRAMALRDPFADLKSAFEPPKEKLKTFNLKQIVTRSGTVLMNMLERLLESTEIDARDVETDQTLLEYACNTGNIGLAKLCYRRGANLSARTKKGESYFNIVTQNQRYDLMEFLHTYGVKVNHQDAEGRTALHVAAANNDVDAICRLIEWGADVNLHDFKKRTPLHTAARNGKKEVTMLLLEVGADLNAKDDKEYTAAAHAEANDHFALMDRLVALGGKGHGLSSKTGGDLTRSGKMLGELNISASLLKSSSLGRIGKVAVKDMPGQMKDRYSSKGFGNSA